MSKDPHTKTVHIQENPDHATLIVIGERVTLRALVTQPGQTVTLTKVPDGSAAALDEGLLFTPDVVGFYDFTVVTEHRVSVRRQFYAAPRAVDTFAAYAGRGRSVFQNMLIESLTSEFIFDGVSETHPFPQQRVGERTETPNFCHLGAPRPGSY